MKQTRQRLVHWFAAEAERVVVHGNHDFRAHIEKRAQGFLRAGVHGAIAVGQVCPNREEGDVGVKTPTYLGEAIEVSSISGVIDGRPCGTLDNISAETSMSIVEHARSPVTRGYSDDGDRESIGHPMVAGRSILRKSADPFGSRTSRSPGRFSQPY